MVEIRIDVQQKLYSSLKKEADYYNMTVEEWLENHLEETYG